MDCQHAVAVKGTAAHHKMRRGCLKPATWNVVIYINPSTKPLVADNYDTSKVSHDYFVCGTHANVLLRNNPCKADAVWHAKATKLGAGNG